MTDNIINFTERKPLFVNTTEANEALARISKETAVPIGDFSAAWAALFTPDVQSQLDTMLEMELKMRGRNDR